MKYVESIVITTYIANIGIFVMPCIMFVKDVDIYCVITFKMFSVELSIIVITCFGILIFL